jgi:hypothetical protein
MATLRDYIPGGQPGTLAGATPTSGGQSPLTPVYAVDNTEAARIAEREGSTQAGLAFKSSMLSNSANYLANEEAVRRAAGDVAGADTLRQQIGGLQQEAAFWAPREQKVEDLNWEPGRIVDYAAAAPGAFAASMVDPMAVATGLRGAAALAGLSKNPLAQAVSRSGNALAAGGAFVPNFMANAGETYNSMAADEHTMANTTPMERAVASGGAGLVMGAMDMIPQAGILKNLGILKGARAQGTILGNTAKGVAGEMATEVAETGVQLGAHQMIDAGRDTSEDMSQLMNAAAQAGLGSGPIHGAGAVAAAMRNRVSEPGDPGVVKGDDVDLKTGKKVAPDFETDLKARSTPEWATNESATRERMRMMEGLPPDGTDLGDEAVSAKFAYDRREAILGELNKAGDEKSKAYAEQLAGFNLDDPFDVLDAEEVMSEAFDHVRPLAGLDDESVSKLIAAAGKRKKSERLFAPQDHIELKGTDNTIAKNVSGLMSGMVSPEAKEKHGEGAVNKFLSGIGRELVSMGAIETDAKDKDGKVVRAKRDPSEGELQRAARLGTIVGSMLRGNTDAALKQIPQAAGIEGGKLLETFTEHAKLHSGKMTPETRLKTQAHQADTADRLVELIPPVRANAMQKAGINVYDDNVKVHLVDALQSMFDGDESKITHAKAVTMFGQRAVSEMEELLGMRLSAEQMITSSATAAPLDSDESMGETSNFDKTQAEKSAVKAPSDSIIYGRSSQGKGITIADMLKGKGKENKLPAFIDTRHPLAQKEREKLMAEYEATAGTGPKTNARIAPLMPSEAQMKAGERGLLDDMPREQREALMLRSIEEDFAAKKGTVVDADDRKREDPVYRAKVEAGGLARGLRGMKNVDRVLSEMYANWRPRSVKAVSDALQENAERLPEAVYQAATQAMQSPDRRAAVRVVHQQIREAIEADTARMKQAISTAAGTQWTEGGDPSRDYFMNKEVLVVEKADATAEKDPDVMTQQEFKDLVSKGKKATDAARKRQDEDAANEMLWKEGMLYFPATEDGGEGVAIKAKHIVAWARNAEFSSTTTTDSAKRKAAAQSKQDNFLSMLSQGMAEMLRQGYITGLPVVIDAQGNAEAFTQPRSRKEVNADRRAELAADPDNAREINRKFDAELRLGGMPASLMLDDGRTAAQFVMSPKFGNFNDNTDGIPESVSRSLRWVAEYLSPDRVSLEQAAVEKFLKRSDEVAPIDGEGFYFGDPTMDGTEADVDAQETAVRNNAIQNATTFANIKYGRNDAVTKAKRIGEELWQQWVMTPAAGVARIKAIAKDLSDKRSWHAAPLAALVSEARARSEKLAPGDKTMMQSLVSKAAGVVLRTMDPSTDRTKIVSALAGTTFDNPGAENTWLAKAARHYAEVEAKRHEKAEQAKEAARLKAGEPAPNATPGKAALPALKATISERKAQRLQTELAGIETRLAEMRDAGAAKEAFTALSARKRAIAKEMAAMEARSTTPTVALGNVDPQGADGVPKIPGDKGPKTTPAQRKAARVAGKAEKTTGTVANPIIGDLWAQDGVKVVSTNLGGVHGRGLAMQAKNKGLIGRDNVDFDSSPEGGEVITLAVKGKAPETAKVAGKPFSEQVVGGNLELLKAELRKLVRYARTKPDTKFYLPFVGLGFGEGNPADIMPVLEKVSAEPNIFMVSKDQATIDKYAASFVPGVRADATSRGEPSVQVRESSASGYASRTKHNADAAGATVAIAADHNTAGEKLTQRVAGNKLLKLDLEGDLTDAGIKLAEHMKKLGTTTLNVAGNGIYTLAKTGWDQQAVNAMVHAIIADAHAIRPITMIVSGGQTGVDIAGAVAAKALGIPAEITLPAGYMQRGADGVDRQHTRAEIGKQIVDGAAEITEKTGKVTYPENSVSGDRKMVGRKAQAAGKSFNIVQLPFGASKAGVFDGHRAGSKNVTNAAPGAPGALGNPFVASDVRGTTSRKEAVAKFKEAFLNRVNNDPAYRDWVLTLRGKDVGYYKPGEPDIHLHVVQEWLASAEAADDRTLSQRDGEKMAQKGPDRVSQPAPSDADLDAVRGLIRKLLGPDVKVAFEKAFDAAGEWLETDKTVRIAIMGLNPMLSTAYHEGLHGFFSKVLADKADVKEMLYRAVNDPKVDRQLRTLLAGETAALAALDADPEEKVAYTFELWATDLLDMPAPDAKGFFGRVRRFFRSVLGLVGDQDKALEIFQALYDGKMAEPSAAQRAVQKAMERGEGMAATRMKRDREVEFFRSMVFSAGKIMRDSESETAQTIGRMFFTNPGSTKGGTEPGYLNLRRNKTNQSMNHLRQTLGGLSPAELKHLTILDNKKTDPESLPDGPTKTALKNLYAFNARFYTYLTQSGLNVGVRDDGRYTPMVWNVEYLINNKDKFVSMLVKEYPEVLTAARAKALIVDPGATTLEDVAGMMHQTLVDRGGVDTKLDAQREDGVLSPFFASENGRSFDWIASEHRAEFLSEDIVEKMTAYIKQGVRAAEYTRAFGPAGEDLAEMLLRKGDTIGMTAKGPVLAKEDGPVMAELREAAVNAKVPADQVEAWVQRRHEDIRRSVGAMEGVLGKDISDRVRQLNSGAMVYQNLRLLPLSIFAAMLDPNGIMVSGGTLNDGLQAYVRGMKKVFSTWKALATGGDIGLDGDEEERAAIIVGSVDSSVFLERMGAAQTSEYIGGTARKINNKFFLANGLTMWDRSMRIAATGTAMRFIKRHAAGENPEHSARWLKDLGLTADDVALGADGKVVVDRNQLARQRAESVAGWGGMTDAQKADQIANLLPKATKDVAKMHAAINRFVERSILSPNAAQRPTWSSDPHFAALFHLKQYTYSFHETIMQHVAEEAGHGNYKAGLQMLMGVPIMITADIVKGLVTGGGSLPGYMANWNMGDWLMHGWARAGLNGIGQIGADAWGDPTSVLGPTIDQIADTVMNPAEKFGNLDMVPGARYLRPELQKGFGMPGV